jgi:agmatine deiminase
LFLRKWANFKYSFDASYVQRKTGNVEGGAIDTNGRGTLLTSEECLMHPDIQVRNPNFTKADYEAVFKEYLGITNVIWLATELKETIHGHIDDLCRFVNEDTIVTIVETDPTDHNKPLQDNLKRLQNAKLENGKSPVIVVLPMPKRLNLTACDCQRVMPIS